MFYIAISASVIDIVTPYVGSGIKRFPVRHPLYGIALRYRTKEEAARALSDLSFWIGYETGRRQRISDVYNPVPEMWNEQTYRRWRSTEKRSNAS